VDKFVHITDVHLRNTPPANRIDDYNESIFKKLEFVFDFCKRKNVKNLLLTGDLADSHTLNCEVTGRLVRLIKKYGLKIYFIYGNHDMNANLVDVDKTAFGLLEEYNWFHVVKDNPIQFNHTVLAGHSFTKSKAVQNTWLFPSENSGKVRILLAHPMITKDPSINIRGHYKQINVNEISTTANILLCGHNHVGWEKPVEVKELDVSSLVVNPGAISRRSITEATEGYGPRLTYIVVYKTGKFVVKFVKIPHLPIRKCFDVDTKIKKKFEEYDRENFISALSEVKKTGIGGAFIDALKSTLTKPPKSLVKVVSQPVIDFCIKKLEESV